LGDELCCGRQSRGRIHTAITRLQLAPQRYYQRPDASHLHLDPDATSLSGFSGRVSVNRNSGLVH
jgi:hypothetical protein